MYRIAICDDEQRELDTTRHMLMSYAAEHPESEIDVTCFQNGTSLLQRIENKTYMPDLILIDIYMRGENGVEISSDLREMGYNNDIVFVTSSDEFALDAYRVNALQYLIKPVQKEKMFQLLEKVLNEIHPSHRYVLLEADGSMRRVALNDIVCCEAQRKCQYMYLTDGSQLCLHMTMSALEKLLSEAAEIVRVGKSYLISLLHVEELNRQEIRMDSGKRLFLPRGSYQPLRERYFDYYCGEE